MVYTLDERSPGTGCFGHTVAISGRPKHRTAPEPELEPKVESVSVISDPEVVVKKLGRPIPLGWRTTENFAEVQSGQAVTPSLTATVDLPVYSNFGSTHYPNDPTRSSQYNNVSYASTELTYVEPWLTAVYRCVNCFSVVKLLLNNSAV